MRALSLFQPYATGVAIGAKRYETRSRRTNYRGPLLICSTASTPGKVWRAALARPPVADAWRALNLLGAWPTQHQWANTGMPHGVALGVVELVDCLEMAAPEDRIGAGSIWTTDADARERAFGDWRPGRFAWRLTNPRPLRRPIPVRGRQRIWNPSAEVVVAVLEEVRACKT